jgi:hypothetical protein
MRSTRRSRGGALCTTPSMLTFTVIPFLQRLFQMFDAQNGFTNITASRHFLAMTAAKFDASLHVKLQKQYLDNQSVA